MKLYATVANDEGSRVVRKGSDKSITIDITRNNKPFISMLVLADSGSVVIHRAKDATITTTQGYIVQ